MEHVPLDEMESMENTHPPMEHVPLEHEKKVERTEKVINHTHPMVWNHRLGNKLKEQRHAQTWQNRQLVNSLVTNSIKIEDIFSIV